VNAHETPNCAPRETVIASGHSAQRYFRDIWEYRELLLFMAWRDLLVRYKQTIIGLAWAILRPLLTMLAFTIIFGKIAKLPSGGIPYPLLVLAAALPWQFIANSLAESSGSLVLNAQVITKVYFPRTIVPVAAILANLADVVITTALLMIFMVFYGMAPGVELLALPLFAGIAFVLALGTGLLFAALNTMYRDFRYIVPFIVQFGLYISPVGFQSGIVPEQWRLLYALNPAVGIIDGFRWSFFGEAAHPDWQAVALSAVLSAGVLCLGFTVFRRMERTFADMV